MRTVPYLLLASAQVAIGAAAIFARYALVSANPLAVAAARMAIAAMLLFALSTLRRRVGRPPTRRERAILSAAGIALAAHFATWIYSLEYATVAISTLLVATTPIWTALYDALFLQRRLSRITMLAFAAGIAGSILAVAFNRTQPPHPGHEILGVALALAGSVAIGAYLILVREIRSTFDTRTIVTHTYGWAALALVVAAAASREPPPPLDASAAWGGIIAMALISQLLGHTALNASLRWFSPSSVSFAALLEPVCAAALAFAIFGESVSRLALAGGVVLLCAVAVVLHQDHRIMEPSNIEIGIVQ